MFTQLSTNELEEKIIVLIRYFGKDYAQIVTNYTELLQRLRHPQFDIDGFVSEFYEPEKLSDDEVVVILNRIRELQDRQLKVQELIKLFLINKFLVNGQVAQMVAQEVNGRTVRLEELQPDTMSTVRFNIKQLFDPKRYTILVRNNIPADQSLEGELSRTLADLQQRYSQAAHSSMAADNIGELREKLVGLLQLDVQELLRETEIEEEQNDQLKSKTELYVERLSSIELDSQLAVGVPSQRRLDGISVSLISQPVGAAVPLEHRSVTESVGQSKSAQAIEVKDAAVQYNAHKHVEKDSNTITVQSETESLNSMSNSSVPSTSSDEERSGMEYSSIIVHHPRQRDAQATISHYHQALGGAARVPGDIGHFNVPDAGESVEQVQRALNAINADKTSLLQPEEILNMVRLTKLKLSKVQENVEKLSNADLKILNFSGPYNIFVTARARAVIDQQKKMLREKIQSSKYPADKQEHQREYHRMNWFCNIQEDLQIGNVCLCVMQLLDCFLKQNQTANDSNMQQLVKLFNDSRESVLRARIVGVAGEDAKTLCVQLRIEILDFGLQMNVTTVPRGVGCNYLISEEHYEYAENIQYYLNETVTLPVADTESFTLHMKPYRVCKINGFVVGLQEIGNTEGGSLESASALDLFKTRTCNALLPLELKLLNQTALEEEIRMLWPFLRWELRELEEIRDLKYNMPELSDRLILVRSAFTMARTALRGEVTKMDVTELDDEDIAILCGCISYYYEA